MVKLTEGFYSQRRCPKVYLEKREKGNKLGSWCAPREFPLIATHVFPIPPASSVPTCSVNEFKIAGKNLQPKAM